MEKQCAFEDLGGMHSKEEHMTIEQQAGLVKLASPKLAGTTGELRDQALLAVAKALTDNKDGTGRGRWDCGSCLKTSEIR